MYYLLGFTLTGLALFHFVHNNEVDTEHDASQTQQEDDGQFSDDMMKAIQDAIGSYEGGQEGEEDYDEDEEGEGSEFLGRANADTYCYARDVESYHYFSTKTMYPDNSESHHLDPVPGCEVKFVWVLARHGVRFGSKLKVMEYVKLGHTRDMIMENVGQDKTELCMDDILNFLLWTPFNIKEMKPNRLTPNGYKLTKKLGSLFKKKFGHLIPDKYDPAKIKIEYSDEKKVLDSVKAITEELFGDAFLPELPPDDILSQVYTECRRPTILDRETHMNYTSLMERSPITLQMVDKVSTKLGFSEKPLDYYNISSLYNGCQYEIAWGREKSPWCAAFTKEDLEVMEYIGDISYFYFCGPGDQYNMFQGCVLLKDFVNQLMSAAASENMEDHHKFALYLGHSTSVLLMALQLGIINDGLRLTHKNYYEAMNRQWRTSLLSPYTANIIAVLYKCKSGEKHKIKLLLNEKPLTFSNICDSNNLCSLNGFYKLFEDIISSEECSTRYCNHTAEEICLHLKLSKEECDEFKLFHKDHYEQNKKYQSKKSEIQDMLVEYRHACVLFCIIFCIILLILTKLEPRLIGSVKKREETVENKKENKESSKPKTVKDNKSKTNESKKMK